MTHEELNEILVDGVRRGMWVAYDDGLEVRFVAREHVTLEIADAAIPVDQLPARLAAGMVEHATG